MRRQRDLIADNVGLLEQIESIIGQLDDRSYVEAPTGLLRDGIGCHIRHCLDFYDCFVRGMHTGLINYDDRERDAACERNRAAAQQRIVSIKSSLIEIGRKPPGQECEVILEGCNHELEAPTRSSLGREMQFLLSHTVHHCALVAVILRWQGRGVPAEFGIAPSSIAHWAMGKRRENAE